MGSEKYYSINAIMLISLSQVNMSWGNVDERYKGPFIKKKTFHISVTGGNNQDFE